MEVERKYKGISMGYRRRGRRNRRLVTWVLRTVLEKGEENLWRKEAGLVDFLLFINDEFFKDRDTPVAAPTAETVV